MPLNFDPETHTYTDEKTGQVVPSVTQIINSCFPYQSYSADGGEYYAQRGKAVHLAIHYIEKGTLDPATVDKDIWPYIEAYLKFRKDFKYKTLSAEELVYHTKYGYAGTLDRRTKGAIWDYKTGAYRHIDGVQLSAYAHARDMPDAHKFSVYLRPNETYKIHEHSGDKSLFPTFLSCFQIFKVKKLHGLLN